MTESFKSKTVSCTAKKKQRKYPPQKKNKHKIKTKQKGLSAMCDPLTPIVT